MLFSNRFHPTLRSEQTDTFGIIKTIGKRIDLKYKIVVFTLIFHFQISNLFPFFFSLSNQYWDGGLFLGRQN